MSPLFATIIPPDRRMLKLALIVASSMLLGGVLIEGGRYVVELSPLAGAPSPPTTWPLSPPTRATTPVTLSPNLLKGPNRQIAIVPPSAVVSIVHVWLQKSPGCMPSFEAMRAIDAKGSLAEGDTPEFNVAYGEVDRAFAVRYGVQRNLVVDADGSAVVYPLGIHEFTTLVIDGSGEIVHRDRPDRDEYVARVRAAVKDARAREKSAREKMAENAARPPPPPDRDVPRPPRLPLWGRD